MKNVQKLILLFVLVLCLKSISAQPIYHTSFQKTFGLHLDDEAHSIIQTRDGGYVITGALCITAHGPWGEFLMMKINAEGNVVWTTLVGNGSWDIGYSLIECANGDFMAIGISDGYIGKFYDMICVRVDSTGNVIWKKAFGNGGTNRFDSGKTLIQTDSSHFLLFGVTDSPIIGSATMNLLLLKIDNAGNYSWSKSVGGNFSEQAKIIIHDHDDLYIAGGDSPSYGSGGSDILLLGVDTAGTMSWGKLYGNSANEQIEGLIVDSTGERLILGTKWTGTGNKDILLFKTDTAGNVLWAKRYGGAGDDFGYSIVNTSDGGYAITGATASYGHGSKDAFLLKVDNRGNMLFAKTYGDTLVDEGYEIKQTADSGYVIIGVTNSFGAGMTDIYVIKTDPNGNSNCHESDVFFTVTDDTINVVNILPTIFAGGGNVSHYLPAVVTNATINTLCYTIDTINVPVDTTNASIEEINMFRVSVFPNPSSGQFTFSNVKGENTIEVFNMLGQRIYSRSFSESQLTIDLADKPKTIYFYSIKDKNKKIIAQGKIMTQ